MTLARLVELGTKGGVRVIAAGLDLDFRGEPFAVVERLAAHAASVTVLTAVCACCGASATRSQRLLEGRSAASTGPTIQHGRSSYEPRCAACHEVEAA